nr:unnamed protein product [Naegleria fowleri]
MFGGLDYQEYRNDLYIFDVKSKEWSQIEIDFGPCARAFHSVIKLDESLIFFGGDGPQGMLNDLFILNISESKWNEIQCDGDIPSRRIRAYLGLKEGQLLCFGGEDCNGRQFDLLSLTLSSRDLEQKPNPAEKNVETINESHQSPSCEEPAKTDDGFVVDFENFTFTIEEDEDETPDIDTTRTTSDSIDAIFDQISNGQDTISVDSLIKCIGNCRIAEHELTWDTILNIVVRITANTDLNQIEASSLQHNRIDCKQFREIANEIAKLKFPSQDSPLEQLIEDYLLPYHTSKKQDMVMNEIYSLPCIMLFLRYSAFLKEIFDIYSSKQKAQAVNKFISLDSFLSFTETFDLVPEKISKTVAESIFNSCFLSEDSSISKTDQGINYPQFLEALGRIAIYIFATKHKNTMAEHMTLLFDALGFFSGNRYNTFLKRARSTNRSNNTNNTKGDIKSTPNKPREIEQKYVDLLQNKHELKAELHNIFMYYCSFGNRLNLDLMSSFKFRLFIRDTNIYTYGFKQESADLIFIKVITNNASKTSNSQKMGFPQFIECLKEIANKLRPTLAPSKAFAQFLLVDVLPNVNRLGSASKCDIGEEAATTAERIFESVRRNLQRLFILYCNSNTTVHYKSVQDTMYLDDFLKLATDFNLIPLISKKDMYGIFKSCLSNADTESLSYQKFEEALLKYAQTAFSKYPYDFKYPSTESKLSLLFEKMELTEWNLLRKRLEKLGRCNIPSPVKSKTKPAN